MNHWQQRVGRFSKRVLTYEKNKLLIYPGGMIMPIIALCYILVLYQSN
jgi:hypothetical protein